MRSKCWGIVDEVAGDAERGVTGNPACVLTNAGACRSRISAGRCDQRWP